MAHGGVDMLVREIDAFIAGVVTDPRQRTETVDLCLTYDAGTVHLDLARGGFNDVADAPTPPLTLSSAPLTDAEAHVLRYLPTNLTFAAIAEERVVSRNTVKTQALSIYRKLGVSSRHAAVKVAIELGLMPSRLDVSPPDGGDYPRRLQE